jgi:hypothetical protein
MYSERLWMFTIYTEKPEIPVEKMGFNLKD